MGFRLKIERTSQTPKLDKFVDGLSLAIELGGVNAAKDFCWNTKGKYAAGAYLTIEKLQEYKVIR